MIEFVENNEAEQIAEQLIEPFHPHLIGLHIAHLSKVKPQPVNPKAPKKPRKAGRQGKKIVMAKTSKVTAKMAALASRNFAFVIEYDWEIWDKLPQEKKVALVDHELCHCGNDADGTYLKHHSVEDFTEVVQRHGMWHSDTLRFLEGVDNAYHGKRAEEIQEVELGQQEGAY